ncbi:MAG TPA: hypothetical protein DHV36_22155 [Desulfobacteraceae bacterium]|nr:hypothetical protein [Desulfobacteraceae bacterium]|tara:strand:- start:1426 stop:1713 length:288 start_codon:yes stop_codon:yes gene_type:complete
MTRAVTITEAQARAYSILYQTARTLLELSEPAGDETLVNTDNIDDLSAACTEVYRLKPIVAGCLGALPADGARAETRAVDIQKDGVLVRGGSNEK